MNYIYNYFYGQKRKTLYKNYFYYISSIKIQINQNLPSFYYG